MERRVKGETDLLNCMICLHRTVNAHMCPHCSKLSCESCIKEWLSEKKYQCPNCRKPLRVQKLVNCARLANELQEAFQKHIDPKPGVGVDVCADHDAPLDYYCRSCQTTVCADCAIMAESKHRVHEIEKLTLIQRKYQDLVRAQLSLLEEYSESLRLKLSQIERREKSIRRAKAERLRQIEAHEESLVNRLNKHYEHRFISLLQTKEHSSEELALVSTICEEYEHQLQRMPKTKLIRKGKEISQFLGQFVRKELSLSRLNKAEPESLYVSDLVPQWKSSTFIVNGFSKLCEKEEIIYTDSVKDLGLEWRLKIYPKGIEQGKGTYLSVFVELVKGVSQVNFYSYRIQLINQKSADQKFSRQHQKSQFSQGECWGYNKYIKFAALAEEGYWVAQTDLLELKLSIRNPIYFNYCQDNSAHIGNLEATIRQLETVLHDQMERSREEQALLSPLNNSIMALIKEDELKGLKEQELSQIWDFDVLSSSDPQARKKQFLLGERQ